MFHIINAVRNTEFLSLVVLMLATGCLAAAVDVQDADNQIQGFHFSSRRLLDNWDDMNRIKGSYYRNNGEKLFVAIGFIVFTVLAGIVALIGWCCVKCFCADYEKRTVPGKVLFTPPGATRTGPSSSNFDLSSYLPRTSTGSYLPSTSTGSYLPSTSSYKAVSRTSSGSCLAPPRSSASVILPVEGESFPLHLYGIENPLYLPSDPGPNSYVVRMPEPTRNGQVPSSEILDMPPSYTTVLEDDDKYPKKNGNS